MEQIEVRKSVGKCKVDETGKVLVIEREYFRQGMVFKDFEAYYNRTNDPCYVPELSDAVYTADSFLDMCNGQKEMADELFEACDWQHPESLKEDWINNEEWKECEECGKIFSCDDIKIVCPHCGRIYEEDE